MPSVSLRDVTVDFPLYQDEGRSLRAGLLRRTLRLAQRRQAPPKGRRALRVLSGVDLEVRDGERVGLIGPNGAGKTTLLKVIGGIYQPTRGSLAVQGRVCPLFDLGLGMDMDATGEENILLRGLTIGFSLAEVRELAPEIAAFSELGEHLGRPVRTYSSGMLLRLTFSVSTAIRPDVLLLDEWIGAGDAHFLHKAQRRLENMVADSRIVVMTTHSPDILRTFCTRLVYLRDGQVVCTGAVDEVFERYSRDTAVADAAE